MKFPFNSFPGKSADSIDEHTAIQMVQRLYLERSITINTGGPFPACFDLSLIRRVLDIACGPGGWAIEVARSHPGILVTGVDSNRQMLEYAMAQMWLQGLSNVKFYEMDIVQPLDFPDNSFDLVSTRLIARSMTRATWPGLIQECLRVIQPGGIICMTECEMSITNSPACEKLNALFAYAMHLSGQSFSPDGRHLGAVFMLDRFLRERGCQDIQKTAHLIDYSAETEAHETFYQNFVLTFKLVYPFLLQMGITTQEEFRQLYHQAQQEMRLKTFCGLWPILTVWGKKPSEARSSVDEEQNFSRWMRSVFYPTE